MAGITLEEFLNMSLEEQLNASSSQKFYIGNDGKPHMVLNFEDEEDED